MPVKKCSEDGKPGYRCGNRGKCYTYKSGDESGRKAAKKKAINQCLAMGEPPGEATRMTFALFLEECDCD